MIELIILIVGCLATCKAASIEEMSPIIWGVVTVLISFGFIALMPGWPVVRVALAVIVAFIAMTGWNVYRSM